jgi:hypothetical protein
MAFSCHGVPPGQYWQGVLFFKCASAAAAIAGCGATWAQGLYTNLNRGGDPATARSDLYVVFLV